MRSAASRGQTYIAQILHDVVEEFRLLEIVAHALDGLPDDEVLGDLRPHGLRLRFHRDEPPPLVQPPLGGPLFHLAAVSAAVVVREEFAPPHAVVALPGHFLARAADAVHFHAVGPGWDVDNGPVFRGAVVGFANVGTLCGLAGVEVFFFRDGVVTGAGLHAGAAAARGAVFVGAFVGDLAAGVDDDVVVVAAAIVFAAVGSAVSKEFQKVVDRKQSRHTDVEFQSHRTCFWEMVNVRARV